MKKRLQKKKVLIWRRLWAGKNYRYRGFLALALGHQTQPDQTRRKLRFEPPILVARFVTMFLFCFAVFLLLRLRREDKQIGL